MEGTQRSKIHGNLHELMHFKNKHSELRSTNFGMTSEGAFMVYVQSANLIERFLVALCLDHEVDVRSTSRSKRPIPSFGICE